MHSGGTESYSGTGGTAEENGKRQGSPVSPVGVLEVVPIRNELIPLRAFSY